MKNAVVNGYNVIFCLVVHPTKFLYKPYVCWVHCENDFNLRIFKTSGELFDFVVIKKYFKQLNTYFFKMMQIRGDERKHCFRNPVWLMVVVSISHDVFVLRLRFQSWFVLNPCVKHLAGFFFNIRIIYEYNEFLYKNTWNLFNICQFAIAIELIRTH